MTSELDKIRRYVELTQVPRQIKTRYNSSMADVFALNRERDSLDALSLAIEYGFAKGYRAAKAEARRTSV